MSGVVTAHSLMPDGGFRRLPGYLMIDGFTATVDLPVGAGVTTVGTLRGIPAVWVVSSGEGGTAPSRFVVVADGVQSDDVNLYERDLVGSVMRADGSAAWHVFWTERGDLR
jgi:hypothetical protein